MDKRLLFGEDGSLVGGAAEGEASPRAATVICPFCHAHDVQPMALFGAQLLTDQYYCRACRTPFEHLRDDATDGDTGA